MEEQINFEQPLEEEGQEKYEGKKVYTDKIDPSIDVLYNDYKRGRLILQADFQRYFVWDMKKSSKLIESVLLDIPLPTIYTSEEDDNKEYVIDGQQRLTSFISFIDGKFPDDREFRLTGLDALTSLVGKTFAELDEVYQNKIKDYPIHKIKFKKESDSDLKFEIFERLNTGAISLNQQELRNCVKRGPYNDLIKSMAKEHDFMTLLGLTEPHKRMIDVELVLRFLAFYNATYLNYKPPIKQFLNKDMDKNKDIAGTDAEKLKTIFKNAVMVTKSMFGDKAFKRFTIGNDTERNGEWGSKFNNSLYDIVMYEAAREDKNKMYQHLDQIREALIYLMTNDQDFIDSIELSTSSVQAVRMRFDKWRQTVENIIGNTEREPRCFTSSLKKELFDKDAICSICGNEIRNIDDAHVDHINQYWKGGRTIPENARLTHRYCNLSRSRKE